ncbi:MAG TPA: type IX secretion system sortase PorU, partial [Saprospiraceae bacterium]|nr:type IX secretion system sortase PorU [Saprospiraceae bacterium]
FIAFNPATDVLTPAYEHAVSNQNLHSLQRADMMVVYYDEFESAALKFTEHRKSHSGLEVVAVPVSQIFNEFSGGSKDPTAIRDFARMIYSRDSRFLYLFLIGDATYDYMNRSTELPYHNYIPAWETEESLDPIRSFPSDDYFALLDGEEGTTLIGAIDIAIGRLPVTTAEEATAIVDKIIHYDTDPSTLGDWRQRVVMVADDEDSNLHLNQADLLATTTSQEHPDLNINKVYLDAYPQESTPGGDRYPAVNADIDLNMQKGALTFTYMGHGGQNGWAQERILGINQAQSYDNLNNMPLFLTATCSFAGYDEPSFKTAGEHLLTNPSGGAIALMTTVRAVYSGSNDRLTRNVLEVIYTPDSPGDFPSISEILRRAKNRGQDTLDINARKFTLLGDPSMILAYPRYDVGVTSINGHPINENILDTLSALEKATISGTIIDDNGEILTDFNGEISLTVFDKVQIRKTLANDDESIERTFATQNKQLFKGAASVVAGRWTIEFVLPKDLDFSYGPGKLSFYAQNGDIDAAGYFTSFIIGGVSSEGLADDQPPVIRLFMNDENFVSGGITDADPDIFILLTDDTGINVSGTGVGHDIEAVLDNDDKNSFILNDFYQASLDNYKSGEVRYPLSDLAPGKHTLKVTAWDLANNPGEAYLEFLVLDDEAPVLEHVLNYPNPFTTLTHFQFEHNRPGVEMNLQVQIYTISGRLVKTIEREAFTPEGYRVADLDWDGLDDSGNQLAKGVYVYRIRAAYKLNGQTDVVESKAEKLVILR